MSKGNVPDKVILSPSSGENVTDTVKMSQTGQEKVPELTDEELALPLEPFERLSVKEKKNRRRQAIVSLMAQDSHITSEEIACAQEELCVEVVANCDHLQSLKFRPTLPYAFTEQGIGQLSTVVHSKI